MTDPLNPYIWALVGLMFLHAVFVACEFALLKLRYDVMTPLAWARLRGNKMIDWLVERSEDIARVIRFGLTGATLAFGFVLYPLALRLEINLSQQLILVSAFLVGLLMHHTISYLVPRALAVKTPKGTLRLTAGPVLLLHFIITPFLFIFRTITEKLFAVFGFTFKDGLNLLDVQVQIRALGEEDPALSPFTQKILQNALRMKELEVSDILLPREQIKFMLTADSIDTNLQKAKEHTHTRFPLCEEDLDHCIGIVHMKDVFRYKGDIEELDLKTIKRPIITVSQDAPIQQVLRKLLRHKIHMAIVTDSFQRTVGVVTLENILEELVGDIQDEFDKEEALIKKLHTGSYRINGLTPLHDVEDTLGVTIEEEAVSTLGGLITARLGYIPEVGSKHEIENLLIEIEDATPKRVVLALVTLPKDPEEQA